MSVILHSAERRADDYLPMILAATNAALWDWNLETNETLVTPRWYEMLGHVPNAFPVNGDMWQTFLHPEDVPKVQHILSEYFAESVTTLEFEWRGRHKDGHYVWIHSSAVAVERTEDRVTRVVGTNIDVTERRTSEQRVGSSEELFRQTFALSPAGMAITAPDGHYLQVNAAYANFVGYTAEEMRNMTIFDVTPLDEREAFRARWFSRDSQSPIVAQAWERPYLHKSGAIKWGIVSGAPVYDEHGNMRFSLAQVIDITERRRAEQELQERSAELRQSQKMEAIGRLAGGIAHDFNNLLMVISAGSEFLEQSTSVDDPRREDIEEIRRATTRAAALTRQLLAFSRKQVLQSTTFLLNDAVTEMERLLQRVIGKDIEFALNLDTDVGAVYADVGQIEQVVLNLVVNARDAMPEGGLLVLGTTRVPRLGSDNVQEGWNARIFVTDTGIGMDAEVAAHAFDPFFTTKGPGKGTGLGLAMVYGIVQQSGGTVELQSHPGMGTRIDITLPEIAVVEPQQEPEIVIVPVKRASGTLLIVDDDDAVRRATGRILQRHGYVVIEANSGREALERWRESGDKIDGVVSDVVMPGISAVSVVDQFRSVRPNLPVIFVSGNTDSKLAPEVVDDRTCVLAKPFSAAGLLEVVDKLVVGVAAA